MPWAVEAKYTNKLVHPVQLYEAGIWIIVLIVVLLTKNKMNDINRCCIITIGCILIRMPIEALRRDANFFMEGGYWLAYKIVIVVSILVLLINNCKKIKQMFNKVVKNDKSIKGQNNKREKWK